MNKKKVIALVSAALCAVISLKALKKAKIFKRRKKQWWIRPGLRRRTCIGFYSALRSKMRSQDPGWYKNFLKMNVNDFDQLVERLTPYIQKNNTTFRAAISVGERLAVTLRYLATGNSFSRLSTLFLLGKSTVCNIIHETCKAIYQALKDEFLKVPSTPEEWADIANRFDDCRNFPNCVGALGGRHIAIQKPANNDCECLNNKNHNSIVLTALVDADYKFLFVDIEARSCKSNSNYFTRSRLLKALTDNTLNFPPAKPLPYEVDPMPFVIVASNAFPQTPRLLKPFSHCSKGKTHKIFNYRLTRARNVVENVFGVCAARFKILSRPLCLTENKAKAIVLAICCIHNFLITRKSVYFRQAEFDIDCNGMSLPENWRLEVTEKVTLSSTQTSNSSIEQLEDSAMTIRANFMKYFITQHGEVHGQYNVTE